MGLDLSTKAGVLRFAELRRGEVTRQYLETGKLEHNPLLYIFATHNVSIDLSLNPPLRLGAKIPRPIAVPCPMPAIVQRMEYQRRTRVFGDSIRAIARASKAIGVLLLMDAWHSSDEKAPPDHHYGWIEENQEGQALFMRLEHQALARPSAWASIIHRDPLRLDPWKGGEQQASAENVRLGNFIDWRS